MLSKIVFILHYALKKCKIGSGKNLLIGKYFNCNLIMYTFISLTFSRNL